MKATHKTQNVANSAPKARAEGAFAVLTLIFLGISTSAAFTPEADEVLDILQSRITSAQAGQASRDAFLENLDGNSGCAEWAADPWWKKYADIRSAVEEACPGITAPKKKRSRARSAHLSASQGVRPQEEGLPDPSLAAALRYSWGGLEAASTGAVVRQRRIWLGGSGWAAQGGRLAFASPSTATEEWEPGRLPRLAFVTGRQSFAGWSGMSGVTGLLASGSAALDGLALQAGREGLQTGAFAAWNRLVPSGAHSGTRKDEARRDALAHSLAIAGRAGSWDWGGQAVHERLETSGAGPVTAVIGGAEIRHASRRFRLGLAGSGLWEQGAGASPEPGVYAEAALTDGKQEGYLLELRQAGPGWANALADIPALVRDTVKGGLILPGRGEGGLTARSRMEIVSGPALRVVTVAAGEAAWILARPAAGDGRLSAILYCDSWSYEAGTGLRWRREGLPSSGGAQTYSQTLGWQKGGWRAQASLGHRTSMATVEAAAWPLVLEAGHRSRGEASLRAGFSAGDALHPGRAFRLSVHQGWKVGAGASLSHSLRLPWDAGGLREDMGYQLKLEISGL